MNYPSTLFSVTNHLVINAKYTKHNGLELLELYSYRFAELRNNFNLNDSTYFVSGHFIKMMETFI